QALLQHGVPSQFSQAFCRNIQIPQAAGQAQSRDQFLQTLNELPSTVLTGGFSTWLAQDDGGQLCVEWGCNLCVEFQHMGQYQGIAQAMGNMKVPAQGVGQGMDCGNGGVGKRLTCQSCA